MESRMNRPIAAARIVVWSMVALAAALPAHAQNFPDRPVRLIIPYGPGGIVDFAGRVLAQKIGDAFGQTVVPENKPGAGGIVGVDYVAHAAPDGYSMALMDPGIVANPTLQKSMPYDIFKDLVTLSVVSSSPEVHRERQDRKSTRLNSSHANISYAVFCLKKKNKQLHIQHAFERYFGIHASIDLRPGWTPGLQRVIHPHRSRL